MLELPVSTSILIALIGATTRVVKEIQLSPNSRTLSIDVINGGMTLLKSSAGEPQREQSVARGLITLMKVSPHLEGCRESHILRQETGDENNNISIIIKPLSVDVNRSL
jgi:hypothetical protein